MSKRKRVYAVAGTMLMMSGIAAPVVAAEPTGAAPFTSSTFGEIPAPDLKDVGAKRLQDNNYTIPSDKSKVKFVDVNTTVPEASQNGTEAAPFNSIQKAVWNASSTDATIVVKSGVYHEYVGVWGKTNLKIQPAPGAEVWLDGSKEVSNFTQSGSTWVADWQDYEGFNTVAGFGSVDQPAPDAFVGPQNPSAADPSQVFIDGKILKQVPSNPGPGQFAMVHNSGSPDKIILGENPAGKKVRSSYIRQAIVTNAPGIQIKGIGFRGYATPLNWKGTVSMIGGSHNALIENVVFDTLPGVPLDVAGSNNVTIRNVTSIRPGLNGFGMYQSDEAKMENNYVYQSNFEQFNSAPTAAGVKVTQMRDFTIVNNEIDDTIRATGIWADESNLNFVIANNRVENAGSNGVYSEISANTVISGNTILNSGSKGIELVGTNEAWVVNNYVEGSRFANLSILMDGRDPKEGGMGVDTRYTAEQNAMNSWNADNTHVLNNVFGPVDTDRGVDQYGWSSGQVDIHDRQGESYATEIMTKFDGNVLQDARFNSRFGTPGHNTVLYKDMKDIDRGTFAFWGQNNVKKEAATVNDMPANATVKPVQAVPAYPAPSFEKVAAPAPTPTPAPTTPAPAPTPTPAPTTPAPQPAPTPAPAPVATLPDTPQPMKMSGAAIVTDDFGRDVASGWGSAQVGGDWNTWGDGFTVKDGAGVMKIAPGTGPGARLSTATSRDYQHIVGMKLDKLPTNTHLELTFVTRENASGRVEQKLRINPDGTTEMSAYVVNSTGKSTLLGTQKNTATKITAGQRFWFEFRSKQNKGQWWSTNTMKLHVGDKVDTFNYLNKSGANQGGGGVAAWSWMNSNAGNDVNVSFDKWISADI